MYLKRQEFEINPDNPFENDKLNRLESAEILTELFKSIDGPFVLCIDSGWGTGKTTFVRMWKEYLSNDENNFRCLYFNAWENDFTDDPLISFIGEMQAEIVASLSEEDSKAKKYFERAKNMSGSLVKRAVPAIIKAATYGVLDLDQITEQTIADLAHKIAQEEIQNYEENKKTLREFKDNLANFVAELSKSDDDNIRPLIIFVDEMDRCRPTYAINLLERIKHLFSVPGVIFVLVLDKAQLAHSIKLSYGADMDVEGYLRRFIDLDYQLPKSSIKDFCNHLFHEFGFVEFFNKRKVKDTHEARNFQEVFVELAELFNLSLREQEQCFTQFSIAFRTTPETYKLYPEFLAFLIVFKVVNRSLYNQYMAEEIPPLQIVDFIRKQPRGRDYLNGNYGQSIEAHILNAFCSHNEIHQLEARYEEELRNEDISEEERKRLQYLLKWQQWFSKNQDYNMGKYLKSKIEILERFKV